MESVDLSIFKNIYISKIYNEVNDPRNQLDIQHCEEDKTVSVNGVSMNYEQFIDFSNIIQQLRKFIEPKLSDFNLKPDGEI